jgi:hypothetical protein
MTSSSDIELGGDLGHLVGPEIAVLDRLDLALDLAQVEEQPLLVGGGAHLDEAPGAQDVFLDRGLDPPHGVGGQPETALRIEFLDGLHQPDIALGDHFPDRQAVAAIAHGDLGDQPQMAGDELVGGLGVLMLEEALGQHVFFLRLQHRELADFGEITVETVLAGRN